MEAQKFKSHDVVKLRSGGLDMVVTKVIGEQVFCTWPGKPDTMDLPFRPDTLEIISSGRDEFIETKSQGERFRFLATSVVAMHELTPELTDVHLLSGYHAYVDMGYDALIEEMRKALLS